MEELDLLCKLEKYHNSLDMCNKELKELRQIISANEIGLKIIDMEKRFKNLLEKKDEFKLTLRKTEQELKGYNYKIKEIDDKLYSGETKDIKQLEKWTIEKDSINDVINDTETMVLMLMEEIEEIEKESKEIKKSLEHIKCRYKKQLIKYSEMENNLNENIKCGRKNINDIEKTIDDKLLNKYRLIRKNKKTAVAGVKNNICSGCNISISTYILENMKKDEEIMYCELCGRILCKQWEI